MSTFSPMPLVSGSSIWKYIMSKKGLILLVLVSLFVWTWSNIGSKRDVDLFSLVSSSSINFSGEKVPLDDSHFYLAQRFAKEMNVLRWNIYQIVLNYKRSGLYFPMIEKKLAEANIPDDFKYLAMAESSLKNEAVSSAAAAGIWQLLPATARENGLVVNETIDERYNSEKATDAAISYLQKSYIKFKDWTLVAASYNRGVTGIQNAITDQGVTSFYDLSLNNETSQYLFRILAAKYCHIYRESFVGKDIL